MVREQQLQHVVPKPLWKEQRQADQPRQFGSMKPGGQMLNLSHHIADCPFSAVDYFCCPVRKWQRVAQRTSRKLTTDPSDSNTHGMC